MSKSSKALVSELKSNRRFRATCPRCGCDIRLADTVMYSLDDTPPAEALTAIQAIRDRIKERKNELAAARARMTTRAQSTAAAVNLGKIIEKIMPSFSTFTHAPGDCRAIFEPIDYLVFSGLTKSREVEKLVFIDIKTGGARLTKGQKSIQQVVDAGDVSFSLTKARRAK